MNIEDLRKLVRLAQCQNLQQTAQELNITAGALSKILKKIEQKLTVSLFDRLGRNLVLNQEGKQFIGYATRLVHEYDQMCSEFNQLAQQKLTMVGPSILLNHGIKDLIKQLAENNLYLKLDAAYEGDAIKQVASGKADIAIVTDEVLSELPSLALAAKPLGKTSFKLACSTEHLLANQQKEIDVSLALNYDFVCPASSPFCGIERGIGSDGWPDKKYPRKIKYRTDDFNSLLTLVKQGSALAYVPDIVIKENGLKEVKLQGFNHQVDEAYSLVYKPSMAYGWLNRLIDNI